MERPRIHHVSVPRPPGPQAAAATRAFYGDLLGLPKLTLPGALTDAPLIWFSLAGDTELHIFAEEPHPNPSERHLCLDVDDVAAMRARLTAAGREIWEATPIAGRPRFFVRDPAGNTIEVTTIIADYRRTA